MDKGTVYVGYSNADEYSRYPSDSDAFRWIEDDLLNYARTD
jgi:hypothetical protein